MYYTAVVLFLFLVGICLQIIPRETVQKSCGYLSPFFLQVTFFHVAPAARFATTMHDVMLSKIFHNLRSVVIVNLLSRFCHARFNYSFFTF